MNNIFVGNLSFQATKEDVKKLFEPFGTVANVVIMEGKKGRSRGYGFLDMPNEEEKNAAISALSGKEFMWRVLSVSSVMPKVKDEIRLEQGPRASVRTKKISKPEHRVVPAKPWRKGTKGQKLSSKVNKGSRPYYGKKDKNAPSSDSKPRQGFKMSHKVSGVPKSRQKMEE